MGVKNLFSKNTSLTNASQTTWSYGSSKIQINSRLKPPRVTWVREEPSDCDITIDGNATTSGGIILGISGTPGTIGSAGTSTTWSIKPSHCPSFDYEYGSSDSFDDTYFRKNPRCDGFKEKKSDGNDGHLHGGFFDATKPLCQSCRQKPEDERPPPTKSPEDVRFCEYIEDVTRKLKNQIVNSSLFAFTKRIFGFDDARSKAGEDGPALSEDGFCKCDKEEPKVFFDKHLDEQTDRSIKIYCKNCNVGVKDTPNKEPTKVKEDRPTRDRDVQTIHHCCCHEASNVQTFHHPRETREQEPKLLRGEVKLHVTNLSWHDYPRKVKESPKPQNYQENVASTHVIDPNDANKKEIAKVNVRNQSIQVDVVDPGKNDGGDSRNLKSKDPIKSIDHNPNNFWDLTILATILFLLVAGILLISTWALYYRNGLPLIYHSGFDGTRMLTYHAASSTVGFSTVLILLCLTYKLFSGFTVQSTTIIHVVLVVIFSSLVYFSFLSGFVYHRREYKSAWHFTSLHSWLALFTVTSIILQIIISAAYFISYGFLTGNLPISKRFRKAHIILGLVTITFATFTLCTGIVLKPVRSYPANSNCSFDDYGNSTMKSVGFKDDNDDKFVVMGEGKLPVPCHRTHILDVLGVVFIFSGILTSVLVMGKFLDRGN